MRRSTVRQAVHTAFATDGAQSPAAGGCMVVGAAAVGVALPVAAVPAPTLFTARTSKL